MSSQQQHHKYKRPDVSVRDKKLEVLNAQLKKVDTEISSLRKQIDQNQVNDATQQERKKLQDQTKEIIKTQAELKTRRNAIHDSIKQLDSQMKRKTNEINEKLGRKAKFSTPQEVKQRLAEIEDSISSGNLSLVDEKMLVKEMQSLNKLNKDLVAIEPIKKSVDQDKAKIVALKEELNQLNPREVAAKFETTQEKLNTLVSKSQTVYDKRQTLYNKRSALYNKRDEIYSQIKQIRADFDNEFQAFKQKLEKERLKREEDQKLSKLLEEKDGQLGKLQEKLSHAKQPAFTFEIEAIENALLSLDPTYEKPKKNVFGELEETKKPESQPVKAVVADDLVLVSNEKEQSNYSNTAPSKSKKHKKKQKSAASATSITDNGRFSLEPTLIAMLAELDVIVPISKEEVPKAIEQLKHKHENFLAKQDEQTDKNISEVEKEIEKLELGYSKKEEQIKKELEAKRVQEKQDDKENN
ncbi:hypothetical protein HG535_0A03870 [Zygotorulaspora mrakii]|uniref:Nuclear segregation protein BFR1 n=1 Tax=Zygotorulaspora mrakii TaxID=42260 RepID=A0A7H9AVQ5_ZYGMR|nr:uncharacterized protein HG535_0A03870 [Zygotorulaspora mrakii]QLG70448.1 hypothetical protein HG535_0A03870 [Zygotorulaspora mrakii]